VRPKAQNVIRVALRPKARNVVRVALRPKVRNVIRVALRPKAQYVSSTSGVVGSNATHGCIHFYAFVLSCVASGPSPWSPTDCLQDS
jgi:hypothetical protein